MKILSFDTDAEIVAFQSTDEQEVVVKVEVDADGDSEGFTDCSTGHIVVLEGREQISDEECAELQEEVEEAVSAYIMMASYESAYGKGSYPI